jgi:hypothetical protein
MNRNLPINWSPEGRTDRKCFFRLRLGTGYHALYKLFQLFRVTYGPPVGHDYRAQDV